MAREEERRRLRRDLHDGLGPQLTGIALGLDELASTSDGRAGVVIRSLRGEITEAIADIRRLVQGLRPPQLDTVGLPDALRSDAERLGRAGVFVDIDIPDELPQLPAAVEVAALRICGEALTNVARHADATRCSVRLVVDGDLHLEIVDDGRGLSARDGAGVGLSSMRERAEEVGGTCQVEAVPTGGCRVRARIPVDAP